MFSKVQVFTLTLKGTPDEKFRDLVDFSITKNSKMPCDRGAISNLSVLMAISECANGVMESDVLDRRYLIPEHVGCDCYVIKKSLRLMVVFRPFKANMWS